MLTITSEDLSDFKGAKVFFQEFGRVLSFADVLRRWQDDQTFRSFFISNLADLPYSAYRWETPALTERNLHRDFECVLIEDLSLVRQADGTPFAEHFMLEPPCGVVEFFNLGHDAVLVAPCPVGEPDSYVCLADFSRRASLEQQHFFWKKVGSAMQRRVSKDPVWLSTAGDGVAWLHVRLDDRPKYYAYQPYR